MTRSTATFDQVTYRSETFAQNWCGLQITFITDNFITDHVHDRRTFITDHVCNIPVIKPVSYFFI